MRFTSLVLIIAVACGDPSDSPDARLGPGGDMPQAGDLYFSFDRGDCDGENVAGIDLEGVWHQDIVFDVGDVGFSVLRWQVDGDRWRAFLTGAQTQKSWVTQSEIWVETSGTRPSGATFRRAYLFCRKDGSGSDRLIGRYIACSTPLNGTESCFGADATSQRVLRREGEGESQGLTLVSEFSGGANPWPSDGSRITVNVRVDDGLAYVARYNDGLRIVDVANPAAPQPLGGVPTATPGEIWNDVKIVTRNADNRKFALMASDERGIAVVDVSTPSAPSLVTTFPDPARYSATQVNVHTLAVETRSGQTYAHLANITTAGLETWNVTDPTNPVYVSSYVSDAFQQPGVFVHGLFVEDGVVYLCYWDEGLVVVDTKPLVPVVLGQFKDYARRTAHSVWVTTAGGRKVAILGDEDYTAHLRVVDADQSSPTYMELLGELELRPWVSIHNIMAAGSTAYVTWYQDGVRLIDLGNPAAPALTGYFNTWEGGPGNSFFEGAIGIDLDLGEKLAYVADVHRGLLILRLP